MFKPEKEFHATGGGQIMASPFVSLKNISKSFPGVKALTDVSLDFYPGDVHVLMGENGAGKSTLIKIISGVYRRDAGKILVNGEEVSFSGVREAAAKGISVIHQELSVVPDLTVAENIFLGREFKLGKTNFIDQTKMVQKAKEVLDLLGIQVSPRQLVRKLNSAEQQMVEIARAVSQQSALLIMDEPTSSLSEKEVESLFRIINKLKNDNVAIVYISHRMKEISRIGDTVSILRDGKLIATRPLYEISKNQMIELMVGREMTQFYHKAQNAVTDEVVLKVSHLTRKDFFTDISFELRKGEILGVAGLIGAGRTEIMQAIFGADKIDAGEIFLFGQKEESMTPKRAIAKGMGLIPEDRRTQGLFLAKSVKENMSIACLADHASRGFIDFKWEAMASKKYISALRIKTPNMEAQTKNLSGGNQQKVVISKWLIAKSRLLIMDEPTRGIDVNAKAEIYLLIKQFIEDGGSVIIISSELPEVLGLSDRILVMREGRLVGILDAKKATETDIMHLASIKH